VPHFTLSIEPNGPIVNAAVSVSEGRRTALLADGQEVPVARTIRALVDTGASFTSIQPHVLQALGLTPTGTIEIVTPSTGSETHTTETYDVDFAIGGANADDPPLVISNLRIATSELFLRQGIHALIGRDVLKRCILVYNGSINAFSLCF
jgi:predicted aspartyl protease